MYAAIIRPLRLILTLCVDVETYELTGKHTYLPMAITAGCVTIMLPLLAALYKELAPRSTPTEGNLVYHVAATFDTTGKEVTGMLVHSEP